MGCFAHPNLTISKFYWLLILAKRIQIKRNTYSQQKIPSLAHFLRGRQQIALKGLCEGPGWTHLFKMSSSFHTLNFFPLTKQLLMLPESSSWLIVSQGRRNYSSSSRCNNLFLSKGSCSMIPHHMTCRSSENFPSWEVTLMIYISVYINDGLKPEYSTEFIFWC